MKKRLTACLLLLCTLFSAIPFAAAAQETELAIDAVWTDAGDFHEGLAKVYDGEKWGYIDTQGELVIDAEWDIANDFCEGYAAVAEVESGLETQTPDKQTWYLIDRSGKVCYGLGENNAYYFDSQPYVSGLSSGTYLVALGNSALYRLETIRPDIELPVTAFPSGTAYKDGYAIVSAAAEGEFTRPEELEYLTSVLGLDAIPDMLVVFFGNITWYSDWGMILAVDNGLVTYHSRTTGLWGIDAIDGTDIVPAEIENLWYSGKNGVYSVFSDGYATVVIDGIYYAVDMLGQKTALGSNPVGRFGDGLFPYCEDEKWGYLTAEGKIAIEAAYLTAAPFVEGVAAVTTEDGAWYIDKQGNKLHEEPFNAAYSVSEGLGRVLVDDCYGFISFTGRPTDADDDTPSFWAVDSIEEAYLAGLMPHTFCSGYRTPATRADVVRLAVTMLTKLEGCSIEELVEQKTGKTLDDVVATYPFLDSADRYMIAATALGILDGYTDGTCRPLRTITRVEAAKILAITAKLAGITPKDEPIVFDDGDSILVWAKPHVDFVSAAGIMGGVGKLAGIGDNCFNPTSSYTREQAIVTMLRIYNNAK